MRRLFSFFLAMKKEGLLFSSILEFSDQLCKKGAYKLIVFINEQLSDLVAHPKFQRYNRRMIEVYKYLKEGKSKDQIVDLISPKKPDLSKVASRIGGKMVLNSTDPDFVDEDPSGYRSIDNGSKPKKKLKIQIV